MEYGELLGVIYIDKENNVKLVIDKKEQLKRLDRYQKYCLTYDLLNLVEYLTKPED